MIDLGIIRGVDEKGFFATMTATIIDLSSKTFFCRFERRKIELVVTELLAEELKSQRMA